MEMSRLATTPGKRLVIPCNRTAGGRLGAAGSADVDDMGSSSAGQGRSGRMAMTADGPGER